MHTLRWQKFTAFDRDYPIFELTDGDVILLDVTKDHTGNLELLFHQGASGRILELTLLERLLVEVKGLLAEEQPI